VSLPQDTVISSFLKTVEVPSGHIETVYRADRHFEAPNWSRDGHFFLINSEGRLYRLSVGAHTLEPIETGSATRINTITGFPGRESLVISAEPTADWLTSSVYLLPLGGGTPRQITTRRRVSGTAGHPTARRWRSSGGATASSTSTRFQ